MTNKNYKILIAEDDTFYLKLLEKYFSKEPYTLITAKDGQEALEKANIFQPEIIISDWIMPNKNGAELCQEVKQNSNLGFNYFVMLTSKDNVDDLVSSLDHGADDFLIKPVNPRELIARVKTGARIIKLQKKLAELKKIEAINLTAITTNHEINNPLQMIIMNAELLLHHMKVLDEKSKFHLNDILKNAMRIRSVTKKLENLSESVSQEYTKGGPQMIDLQESI